jgi:hypothetical protein
MDAVYLVVVFFFFLMTLGLLKLCERLMGRDS